MNKICDECETVAHCTKHGCIPKVSVNEAMKLALEALQEVYWSSRSAKHDEAITALREALAKPAQPKYRRGDRLICLETEEYCVIHISGTDRQWVKFPTSYIGVYTNEQVAELFELLPKEPAQQEPVAWAVYWGYRLERKNSVHFDRKTADAVASEIVSVQTEVRPLYTSPPAQREPVAQQQPTSPDVRDALLFCLWHHQGGSSKIGQPIRHALGIGKYERMNDEQLEAAKRVQTALIPPAQRKPLTDEQIDAAVKAWFENDIVPGRQPFARRMRAAIEAARGIKGE